MHRRRSRSSYILDLARNEISSNQIRENENNVPDSPVRMSESDFKALEALVDDELSSDRPWTPSQNCISFATFEAPADKVNSDTDEIPDSNEDSLVDSPTAPNCVALTIPKKALRPLVNTPIVNSPQDVSTNHLSHVSLQNTFPTRSENSNACETSESSTGSSATDKNNILPRDLNDSQIISEIDDSAPILDSNEESIVESPTPPNYIAQTIPEKTLDPIVNTPLENSPQDLETDNSAPIPSISSLVTISDCESPYSPQINKKRKSSFKRNSGKKRAREEQTWIDNKRKLLLNTGQQYTTRKGKEMKAKELGPTCSSTCKKECYKKFDLNIRGNIKNNFWHLGDHAKQWDYINTFTKKVNKKSRTTEGESRRDYTTQYYLPLPSENKFVEENVCMKTFLNTLCISDQFVRTAHNKLNLEGSTVSDNRGKHENHPVIVNSAVTKSVCDHVASFQPVESHYTRKNSSKLYLSNDLNMTKMFKLYKDWDQLGSYENKATTLRQYRDVVNKHMNIEFFTPKKDICDKCHAFSNENMPTEEQIEAHNRHINNKTVARELKNEDKKMANECPEILCATFDFQKILNAPHGDVGLLYYKRKLSVFNFTVFDVAKLEGFCYMWTEITAKRGANEVSSCLRLFMKENIDKGSKQFRFWSDNCSGQNRNRVVYSMYMDISRELKVDITHRFLEQGHTQNEGDSVHALIEKESKRKMVYTPDQWYALVRWAKTNGKPYRVIEIDQSHIIDYKPLLENRNWKKDTANENVKWNCIKEISVRKEEADCIYFKYDLKGEYHCLKTILGTRRRGQRIPAANEELKVAYSGMLPVTEAKHKDLVSLCDTGVIPREYHRFFKELKHSADTSDVVDDFD